MSAHGLSQGYPQENDLGQICSQKNSHGYWLVSDPYWLLAGDFGSSLHGPLHRAAHSLTLGFPYNSELAREWRELSDGSSGLCALISEWHLITLAKSKSLGPAHTERAGITSKLNTRRQRSSGPPERLPATPGQIERVRFPFLTCFGDKATKM